MLVWGAGWDLADDYRGSVELVIYVVALCVLEIAASLLVFGLVRPWGEIWPAWFPWLGGRRIPARFVITVASIGATLVTVLLVVIIAQISMLTAQGVSNPVLQVHGWHRWFLIAHYALWPLWPLGLWTAIVAYAKRRASSPRNTT